MVLLRSAASTLLLFAIGTSQVAAASWTFDDASVIVTAKKGGEGVKEKCVCLCLRRDSGSLLSFFGSNANLTPPLGRLSAKSPLSKSLQLGSADSLKIILTAKDDGKGKRPHQTFVLLQEPETGLEAPFPLIVKESGKAVAQIVRLRLSQSLCIIPAAHPACSPPMSS